MPLHSQYMEGTVMKALVTAAAAAAALWAVMRWLDHRYDKDVQIKRSPIESWETDGGALAPHPAGFETSQVPR